MKSKPLNKAGNFIRLSGEIGKNYTVPPGVKITFSEGSTFEGTVLNSGITFCNNTNVVKQFVLNPSGQIQLALVSTELIELDNHLSPYSSFSHGHQGVDEGRPEKLSVLIVPSSDQQSEFGDDGISELGLSREFFIYQRSLASIPKRELCEGSLADAQNQTDKTALSGENAEGLTCYGCILL